MLKAVIFDFDGTLVATEEQYNINFNELIKPLGARMLPEDVPYLIGTGAEIKAAYLNEKYGYHIDGAALNDAFRQKNIETIDVRIGEMVYDDVKEAVEETYRRGYTLYVCSNSRREKILKALRAHSLESYFKDIYSGSDLGMRKPDPSLYRYLLQNEGYTGEEVIAIEDSASGVRSAEEVGIEAIGLCRLVTEDMLPTGIHIRSLKELGDVLDTFQ